MRPGGAWGPVTLDPEQECDVLEIALEDHHAVPLEQARKGRLEQRGLPRAVRAQQPEDLALLNRERDVIDRDESAVAFLEVLYIDNGCH